MIFLGFPIENDYTTFGHFIEEMLCSLITVMQTGNPQMLPWQRYSTTQTLSEISFRKISRKQIR